MTAANAKAQKRGEPLALLTRQSPSNDRDREMLVEFRSPLLGSKLGSCCVPVLPLLSYNITIAATQ